MKRFISIVLSVLTMIITFSCCSNGFRTTTSEDDISVADVNMKANKISFFTLKTESRDFFKQLFNEFKEEMGITVEDEYNANSYYSVLAIRAAANEMPDIFSVYPDKGVTSGIYWLGPQGYLLDITNESFVSEYLDNVNNQMKTDGKLYSISCDIQVLPVLYNKKLFRQAGIHKTPANINEWWDVCAKLKEYGIAPMASNAKDNGWFFEMTAIAPSVVFAKDMEWQNKRDNGEVKFDSDLWKNVFAIPIEMINKGYYIDRPLTRSYADSINMFAGSKTAMLIIGSWEFENIKRIGGEDLEFGAFFFPGNESGEDLVYPSSIGDLFAISSMTKKPDECKKLLEYFTKRNTDMRRAFGGFSTIRNASTDNLSSILEELLPDFKNCKNYAFINNGWPEDFQCVDTKLLIAGGTTLEKELQECDLRFDESYSKERKRKNK